MIPLIIGGSISYLIVSGLVLEKLERENISDSEGRLIASVCWVVFVPVILAGTVYRMRRAQVNKKILKKAKVDLPTARALP